MKTTNRFAQSTTTTGGETRQLSGSYILTVLPDSIISELPYFGRMYQAPMNSQDNGIHFTLSKFEYSNKHRKKGGWDIQVKTMDAKTHHNFFLPCIRMELPPCVLTVAIGNPLPILVLLRKPVKNNKRMEIFM